jgi:hypothetical protein
MKLTKARLKRLIKEAVEEQEGLGDTYDFLIYSAGMYRSSPSSPVAYVTGVPLDKLDTSDFVKYKEEGYESPERFLKLKPEFMEELGFAGLSARQLEEGLPESIQITANYNLHTEELTPLHTPPRIIAYKP